MEVPAAVEEPYVEPPKPAEPEPEPEALAEQPPMKRGAHLWAGAFTGLYAEEGRT